jgi:PBP1b-binding outer membrane lipoprotein LpoB
MKRIEEILEKYFKTITIVLLATIFINTCGNPNKSVNKRLDALTAKIDSLQSTSLTEKDLKLEGLNAEKRMIQATDRKMLDVQRQTQIDEEIKKLK